jgi:cation:H+ antiporter
VELFYAALAVVLGLVALVYGADRFVLGAATAAHRLGVSPLVVGVLVVGLGTSAPEMLVSAVAAYNERGGMAVGNAVGSNISNIGLVLGTAALIAPIDLRASVIRRELPILLLVTGGTLAVLYDARVSRLDGVLLLVAFVVYLVRTFRVGGASASGDPPAEESPAEEAAAGEGDEPPTTGAAAAWLVFGLALLLGGSRAVVWGASNVAQAYGVSDLVIGLTVVAIGTSLPELAASVTSAIKGHHDLAVGNVIGSNTFNLLAVLSIPGLLHPEPVDPEVVTRDYVVMGAMTVLLFLMARGFRARGRINRWEGLTLLLCFIGYMTWVGTHAAG